MTIAHVYPSGLQVLLDLRLLQPGQGWAGLSPHNGLHQGLCMGYSGHGCQGGAWLWGNLHQSTTLLETLDTALELGGHLLRRGLVHTAALGATENRRGACVNLRRRGCADFMPTVVGSIVFSMMDPVTSAVSAVLPALWAPKCNPQWAPLSIKTT